MSWVSSRSSAWACLKSALQETNSTEDYRTLWPALAGLIGFLIERGSAALRRSEDRNDTFAAYRQLPRP